MTEFVNGVIENNEFSDFVANDSLPTTDCPPVIVTTKGSQHISNSKEELNYSDIQWMFPITDPKQSIGSPVIDVAELRSHPDFEVAKGMMLTESIPEVEAYWGIVDRKVVDMQKLERLDGHSGQWFGRVMQSMVYYGLGKEADKLLNLVLSYDSRLKPDMVGSVTVWECKLMQAKEEVNALGI